MSHTVTFSGVMPANVLPFTPDYAIDEPNYRRHLQWLADVPGVTGRVVNGHAAEVSSLQRGDMEAARQVNDRLEPLVRVFYAPSFVDMHNRMKEALALLGRIDRAVARPPLQPIGDAERQRIAAALRQAHLHEAAAAD